jgi:ADP-heptose:LPS heptosyltransferase
MLPAASNRFLICRLNSVSEVILTLPVACALKDSFPECWVGWVVEEPARSVVHGHRAVDETITLPAGWSTSLTAIRSAKAHLRLHNVDIAIDCQGSVSSALAGKLSGARRLIGYAGMGASKLARLLSNERVTPVFSHLTDRSLELLTPLGINTPQVRWDIPITPLAKAWAKRWRQSVASRGLAIMTPNATWKSKRWEVDRFASTANYIHDRYGYQTVVVWNSYDDRLMAEEIVAESSSTATLAPHTDLTHLAAMIRTADLFIGGDCEALHLAVAVGTQSIGLYGTTRPCDSGPYGHISLQRAYEHGSLKRLQRSDNTAMKTIGVEHVCQVIDQIESGYNRNDRSAA